MIQVTVGEKGGSGRGGEPVRTGLVGCVKQKRDEPAPARDLYVSPLFRKRRAHAERTCDDWVILSALHGVVSPEQVLEPYDSTLKTMGAAERRSWAAAVASELARRFGNLDQHVFEVHAGSEYIDYGLEERLRHAGAEVERPLRGLSLGQQLAWYTNDDVRRPPKEDATPSSQPYGGAYSPLTRELGMAAGDVSLTFEELEDLLDRGLPASARLHRAWWANDESHSHARAWLEAGYRVDSVSLEAERVRFGRDA